MFKLKIKNNLHRKAFDKQLILGLHCPDNGMVHQECDLACSLQFTTERTAL